MGVQAPPWDVIVVGGGPAGLAAALMLGRYRRPTLLFDDNRPRNASTGAIHGVPGLEGLSAQALRERAWAQIDRYPDVCRREERVTRAWREASGLLAVETSAGATECARRLLLATGVEDRCPDDVAGFAPFYGRSIHHCPDCDGYEASGKRIAIIARGEQAATYALEFLNWTDAITVLTHGRGEGVPADHAARLAAVGIGLDPRRLTRFKGDDGRLTGIRFADGALLPCQAAYFSLGQRPRAELAQQLGCALTARGHVEQDRRQRTSVPESSPQATWRRRMRRWRWRWRRGR